MQAALGLVVTLALMSCAGGPLQGYPGAPRPDSETALVGVERTTQSHPANVQITSIDAPRSEVIPVTARSVRLLPREVCLGVLATTSTMNREAAELCFDARPGSRYEIRALVAGIERDLEDATAGLPRQAERGPFRITRIWIVDVATSQTVAFFNP